MLLRARRRRLRLRRLRLRPRGGADAHQGDEQRQAA
jgi:hypothetical protein